MGVLTRVLRRVPDGPIGFRLVRCLGLGSPQPSLPPAFYTVALFYLIPYYCIKKYRAPPQHPLSPFSLTKMIEEKNRIIDYIQGPICH